MLRLRIRCNDFECRSRCMEEEGGGGGDDGVSSVLFEVMDSRTNSGSDKRALGSRRMSSAGMGSRMNSGSDSNCSGARSRGGWKAASCPWNRRASECCASCSTNAVRLASSRCFARSSRDCIPPSRTYDWSFSERSVAFPNSSSMFSSSRMSDSFSFCLPFFEEVDDEDPAMRARSSCCTFEDRSSTRWLCS